jgi:type IV pilus assembly protein PilV
MSLQDRSKKRSEQGFSLIEVMITLSIFAVGVLAVALMQDLSIQHNASARLMSEAIEVAQSQMARLMGAPYDDANLDEFSSPYGPNSIGHYRVSWTVQEDVPMSDMKTIKLTVAWSDQGAEKSLAVASIKQ